MNRDKMEISRARIAKSAEVLMRQAIRREEEERRKRGSDDSLIAANIEQFLFCVSNPHISDKEMEKTTKRKIAHAMRRVLKMGYEMTKEEFLQETKKVYVCCLTHIRDLHELHKKRAIAVEILNDILDRANPSYINVTQVVHITWSIMSCIHHFQLRFKSGTNFLVTWDRRKKAEACMITYDKLIRKFPRYRHRVILNAIICFYKTGKLWEIEFACTDLVCKLLYLYDNIEEALDDILRTAEVSSLYNETEAKHLIQVLYEVLEKISWKCISERMLRIFLEMLRKSIIPDLSSSYNYVPMRRGLNICLRNITKNLRNKNLLTLIIIIFCKIYKFEMRENTLLEFGSIAEFAALRYKTGKLEDTFIPEFTKYLSPLILSTNALRNLIGVRIYQNLLDRMDNKVEFDSPKIFFRDCKYNIKLNSTSIDKNFSRQRRGNMQFIVMQSIKNHYNSRANLENIYGLLCLFCVEVPCGYISSMVACLAMRIQEFALTNSKIEMTNSHHLHATVMALMSLVCHIHNAEIFYNYVNTIMERRAEWAPHLNPPLKARYEYAQHHILWSRPDLFFEDWEVRYGLWKCFRTRFKRKKDRSGKSKAGHSGHSSNP